jgi:hypothetical protein
LRLALTPAFAHTPFLPVLRTQLAQTLLGRNIPRAGSARNIDGSSSPLAPGSGGGAAIMRVGSRLSVTNSFVGSPMVSSRYFTDNA